MQVLIADDDPVLRFALRQHLERWSFDVVECVDGTEAWQVLQEPSPPLLAIIDWSMPGIDGPTLARDLREVPALAGMYVILLTSNTSKQDVIAGLESGADDYITKPFDWGELRARVRIGSRIVPAAGARCARQRASTGTRERADTERALADLRVLQAHPRRPGLLEANRTLPVRALERALQSRHLPGVHEATSP